MVTQTYLDFKNKDDVELIKPTPFKSSSFGEYGRHHLMGSWKNNENKKIEIKKKNLE